jgi:hypothetical protein
MTGRRAARIDLTYLILLDEVFASGKSIFNRAVPVLEADGGADWAPLPERGESLS